MTQAPRTPTLWAHHGEDSGSGRALRGYSYGSELLTHDGAVACLVAFAATLHRLHESLSAVDLHLVTLAEKMVGVVHPSKV